MNSTTFKGYQIKITNSKGETFPARVINENKAARFKSDGTIGHALKIQEQAYGRPTNPFAELSPLVNVGAPFWVRASKLNFVRDTLRRG